MHRYDNEQADQGQHFQESVNVLLSGRYFSCAIGVAYIPNGGCLVCEKAHDHDADNERIDFEKYRSKRRNRHFCELQKMQKSLPPAARQLYGRGSMAEIIRKT